MGVYQKFRGDPEKKLFFLLENFLGGINTEFSDDNSGDTDFESIINFEMDKLGTLNKRGGFGEINALSQILNKIPINRFPYVQNRSETNPFPETGNNNIVYAKLLQNDNGCFRALAGFSGEDAYRKYQELYGFQNNRFKLLIITADFVSDEVVNGSHAFYYEVYLPDLEYDGQGHPTDTETLVVNHYVIELPVNFKWNRNLMNIETIEFYDKIFFTSNDGGLITFDRSDTIASDANLAAAFTYNGWTDVTHSVLNAAYVPSGLEIRHIGFNVLCDNPMTAINTTGISNKTIQGVYISTTDNIPLVNAIPLGKPFLLNVIYTAESGFSGDFDIEMKEGDNALTFTKTINSTYTREGLKSYNIQFQDVPDGEVEIKITMVDGSSQPISGLQPYYDYYPVEQIDTELKPATQLNIGDYGICEMYSRAVYYKGDTIWFSDINNFSYVPHSNWVTLPIEPTDRITKICYFKKGYIIFTKERIYKMVGSFGQSDFAVQPVNMSIGCHAGNTVVPIEDTLFFASPRGLYALKSSTFVEGFENVKEVDVKVKTLTNNFTKFNDDLARPAIRFNGINEKAYATRYKDKYLLFYNNYGDMGDYAAQNDLDTLVYQFDIGSYTTYRFKEKPTFLFMVDNAIETFSTRLEEPVYDDEETVLEYDFTTAEGTVVEDLSGNERDGIIKGDYGIVDKKGIALDGETSYTKTDPRNITFEDGFSIKMDVESSEYTPYYYPTIPLFHFTNYVDTFPDFTQTKSTFSSIRLIRVATYYLYATITYAYSQVNATTVRIKPTITLNASDVAIKVGSVSYKVMSTETTYIDEGPSTISLGDELTKTIELPSFLMSMSAGTYIDDELTFTLDYDVTNIGTFSILDINKYTNEISLVNMAYGGGSNNKPYYEFYAHIDNGDGKLRTRMFFTNNYNNADYIIDGDYSLVGNTVYDFTKRQTIEVRYTREGNYLKCSSYINNEFIEDIGYLPIELVRLLPTKALNRLEGLREGTDYNEMQYFVGNVYYEEMLLNGFIAKYNFTEGEGSIARDTGNHYPLTLNNCEWVSPEAGLILDGENTYVEIPTLSQLIKFEQGFSIEFEGSFPDNEKAKIFDIATLYDNDKAENKNGSINCFIENSTLGFESNALNFKSFKFKSAWNNPDASYKYKFNCVYIGDKKYRLDIYIDDTLFQTATFIGSVSNIIRTSNFIGKSNTTTDKLVKGVLKNFKISIFTSNDAPSYRNSLFEFDISPTDFGKDIYVEAITKGINMRYPQHMKKLKHIFVKAIGGNKYGEFFFELYADGHRVNDPRKFYVYKDENGTLVYDYTGERIFSLDEINSVLGNIRLDETKLGEGKYQTKKLVIPKKAKNFSCRIYGNTDDYLSLESFGFVCKLGKVKEG
ncbi:MAG: hypothetical protein IKN65_00115 [Clostridia bacterium]|nr:hypothetical protein [Clostridia bacterium]